MDCWTEYKSCLMMDVMCWLLMTTDSAL